MATNITCSLTEKYFPKNNACVNDALKNPYYNRTTAFVKDEKGSFILSGTIKCPQDPLCNCVTEPFAQISSTKCYYSAQGNMVCGKNAEKQYSSCKKV